MTMKLVEGQARTEEGIEKMTTTLAPDTNELQNLCALPTLDALPRAAAFLAGLVQDHSFLESQVRPLLEEAQGAERWYVARRWDAADRSFSLQVFVWPPGTRTMIHDHSSWGAYACAFGTVLEERYERLDDGSRFEHARLEEAWQLSWSPQDGASTMLPGNGGVHRVGNPHETAAVSVHLYGPRMGEVDGRDYDPSRDYVCDRMDDETDEIGASGGQEWPAHGNSDASGNSIYAFTPAQKVGVGRTVTATVYDPAGGDSTSEFSAPRTVAQK
jgi:predicted metal-dependent enzyme (double-stranded beta helix superfamily)